MKQPVRVAVTGAAGQIGYSLLFRIASGEMLGCFGLTEPDHGSNPSGMTTKFEDKGDHVLMTDIVNYAMPFGPLGRIVHALWVKKKLQGIFDYRTTVINRIFPS